MKQDIIRLRSEGLTYKQIATQLGCSISTISYHCSEGQKQKTRDRQKESDTKLIRKKVDNFTGNLRTKCSSFSKDRKTGERDSRFGYKDVVAKFGRHTKCYLTGRDIDLYQDDYHFDHIVSLANGGESTLDNLGIACSHANFAKSSGTVEELLGLCKEILTNHGYEVNNRSIAQSG